MTRARIGQSRPSVQMWMLVVGSFLAQVASFSSSSTSPKFQVDPTLQPTYQYARTVRVVEGHDAATEYYQQILQQNPLDRTAATHIAACPETPQIQEQMLDASTHEIRQLRKLLQKVDFTTSAIADLVLSKEASENLFSVAPLFLNPLPAGAKVPPLPTCQRSCLIQLFLLSVCIPLSTWKDLLFTVADLELLSAIGIVTIDRDTELIVPHCHIMPVELPPALGESHHKSLFVLTDLHPRVLSTIHAGQKGHSPIEETPGAVMYIGPDSVALVQHFCMHLSTADGIRSIVDCGTGSGIQGLTAAISAECEDVTLVDINPRALKFARFNFLLNGLSEPTLLLGDLRTEYGQQWLKKDEDAAFYHSRPRPWKELLPAEIDLLLSNPPFLPVPISDDVINKRYGLFSGGGESGEDLLRIVVSLASTLLAEKGMLAIVSEFMNPDSVPIRVKGWWGDESVGKGLLLTNEYPIDDKTYSERRADSAAEMEVWKKHLQNEGIQLVSPGLLFVRKDDDSSQDEMKVRHEKIPKTTQGSIWTPANKLAVDFTRNAYQTDFG